MLNKKIVRRQRFVTYSSAFLFGCFGVFMAIGRCAYLIKQNYLDQLEKNLADVAHQDALSLSTSMGFFQDLMVSVAKRFELEPEKRMENLYMFEPVAESFGLKRIGYIDINGIAHGTSGREMNLSYRKFFEDGMAGKTSISGDVRDAMDDAHDHVIIFTMPLRDSNDQVDGIVGLTYPTESLSDDFSISSFDGLGSTFVYDESDTVIISSNHDLIEPFDNIVDLLWAEMGKDFNNRNEMIDKVLRGKGYDEDANGIMSLNGEDFYYHIASVSLMDDAATWNVLSVVPCKYLQTRFHESKINLYRMIAMVLILGSIAVGIITVQRLRRNKVVESLAFFSPLTKGHNKDYFIRILNLNHISEGYVIAMNLENFANISYAIGKDKTDTILAKIHEILCSHEGDDDVFSHENSDQFLLYMNEPSDNKLKQRLVAFTQEIGKAAEAEHIAWLKAKYGIYKLSGVEKSEPAIQKAKIALNETKESNMFYAFYDNNKQVVEQENQAFAQYLPTALEKEEFVIYYQAKVNAQTGEISGAEALVRWSYKGERFLPPGMFIPLFERNGKIHLLDTYIFKHVCKQQAEWKKAGLPIVPISVNLSKASLFRPRTVEKYLGIIKENGLSPKDIQIEVTETLVSSDNMSTLLNRFRDAGVKVLLDDFGQGDTALGVLNLNCFDTLKIDKCLVDAAEDEESAGAKLLVGVLFLAKGLGYHLTVEGVEKQNQVDFLRETQCDDIQGYFFAKPEPAETYQKRLEVTV